MIGSKAYHKMAINLVQGVLERGKNIHNDRGMAICYKDKDGKITGFGAFKNGKDGQLKMLTLYEGIFSINAAKHYVDAIGEFAAIGDALAIYREKKDNSKVIDV